MRILKRRTLQRAALLLFGRIRRIYGITPGGYAMKLPNSTYDISYQYSPRGRGIDITCGHQPFIGTGVSPKAWHTHVAQDAETTDIILRMLSDMNRNCRVRQNATGRVVEVAPARGVRPPLLLHLFFIGISGRCGKDTDI